MAVFPAVAQSEWTKIRSVRSTVWSLVSVFLITVALGLAISLVARNNPTDFTEGGRPFDATAISFIGVGFGRLAIVVFGVLAVGNEYSSGMIRVSLAAVPQRGTLLAAKTAVLGALALAASLVTVFVAFFVGQAALGGGLSTSLGAENVLRAVVGTALYLTLLCLLSAGVTVMVRHQILALAILVPFILLISPILTLVPVVKDWIKYFPDQTGGAITQVVPTDDLPYGPWTGLLICAAWTAAALLGGYLVLKRRDA
ncbi:ABC transporter [Kitasatospora phosalacinea]|uniref:ABC transporter n=1 Tax=Kitasatospora phosalacinea TaxID=2065 RepID=A0A9W6Q341_9ACTN|nr:ABC transporter permease [Kitasatospora phosalacinea]GLW69195.1 ABC transporter [Kitasatospora phosalacinea]